MTTFMARLLAGLFLLVAATPAWAQTDDLITNDAITLMGAIKAVGDIGSQCLAVTGNDPEVAAAFAGWEARNQAFQIAVVSTIGTRGVPVAPAAFELGREKVRALIEPGLLSADDQPAWCRRMSSDITQQETTAATLFAAEAQRLEEARRGERPMLDVANAIEVWSAGLIKARFAEIETLMERCAARFGGPFYEDGFAYWRSRNLEAWQNAERVLQNWGALAPERAEQSRANGVLKLDIAYYTEELLRARCESFVRGVESGAEDIATTDASLFSNVARYAAAEPN